MWSRRTSWFVASLLGVGCLFYIGAPPLSAGGKKDKGDEILYSKVEPLSDTDEKDTKLKNSYRRVHVVKMTKGKVYRIDLASKDFDTFLRLEDAQKKELDFNDDIDLRNKELDSRLIFLAPKTGEYRLIVTSYEPAKTGLFTLEMKYASKTEAADAIRMDRIKRLAALPAAERTKVLQEVTKQFSDKGGNLTIKDAQLAILVAMATEELGAKTARETYTSFSKIFGAADNEQVASVAKYLDREMGKLKLLGKEFPVSGKTVDGKEFDLKKLKGKVVLVDFWATWCGPCIAELPNMQAAYKQFHGKGFDIVGISLDRPGDDEKLAKFIKDRKMPWACINIDDSRPLANKYQVNAIPFPVLIDREGRVVSYRARGPALERLLEKLLAEKK